MNRKVLPHLVTLIILSALLLPAGGPTAAARPGPGLQPDSAPAQAGRGAHSGGDMLVSADTQNLLAPAIAYNPTDDEFLAVWVAYASLIGQRYSAQGVPHGESFTICNADVYNDYPAVAYNPASHGYLVVWRRALPTSWVIHGQLLGADGALLDNPFTPEDESDPAVSFAIGDPGLGHQSQPAVAYNATADEYLVVWEDDRSGNLDLYGRRVDADGFFLTDNLALVTDTATQADANVAYNKTADDYLLVWRDYREGPDRIYCMLVDELGNPASPAQALSPNQAADASLAYDATQNQYLVAWREPGPSTGHDIGGQIVNAAGSPVGAHLTICANTELQEQPQVTYNSTLHQYLVVWTDWRNSAGTSADVYGQRVGGDGTLAEQGNFVIAGTADREERPVVAYSSGSGQYLVLWQVLMAGNTYTIRGQRLGWPGLPLGAPVNFAAPPGRQETPAIAYNSRYHEYMVVWADARDGNWTIAVYAQRYDRDGAPLGENVRLAVEEDIPYEQPAVAYNSFANKYLVAWDSGFSKWCLVSPQGTTGACGIAYGRQPAVGSNSAANTYLMVFADIPYGITGMGVDSTGTVVAPAFDISDSEQGDTNPAVIYNPAAGQYLVVWENSGYDRDIHARRVAADFSLVGTQDITLTAGLGDQVSPAVAYNPAANEYLVAWTDYRDSGTSGADIYVQRVGANGSRLGSNIRVTAAAGDQRNPALAYISALDRYRIVWEDGRNPANGLDLYGQWLAADGTPLAPFDRPVFRYPGDQRAPVLAYSPGYDNALTVWQDERNGSGADIYARFGALDTTPPVARFNYAPSFGQVGDSFTLNARPSTDNATPSGLLLVRWDLNGDGNWDTPLSLQKVVTGTLPAPGVYTITLEVWDMAALTSTVSHPITVLAPFLGVQAAHPTATLVVSPTYGPAGTVFAFDGSASSGSGTLMARWDWEDDGAFDTPFTTTLTATHAYTIAGNYTVRLDVRDLGSGLSDIALRNITVLPGPVVSLEVRPEEVTLYTGEATYFLPLAADIYGNPLYHPTVNWSVSDPLAGTIDASGFFTASNMPGEYPDAVLAESNGVSTNASVVVLERIYWVYLPVVLKGD